jgi:hypothetical protein
MNGHNRVKDIYICLNGENLWKYFQETTDRKKFKFTYKVI